MAVSMIGYDAGRDQRNRNENRDDKMDASTDGRMQCGKFSHRDRGRN